MERIILKLFANHGFQRRWFRKWFILLFICTWSIEYKSPLVEKNAIPTWVKKYLALPHVLNDMELGAIHNFSNFSLPAVQKIWKILNFTVQFQTKSSSSTQIIQFWNFFPFRLEIFKIWIIWLAEGGSDYFSITFSSAEGDL